ncbi:MAG TPA: fatty acid--CoA ligase family protein [Candidatus Thermoplasmatota archaeon]|nr:fatty acid--CoA ligase family protein [Candidatus Thermoplasmatota archaeon]
MLATYAGETRPLPALRLAPDAQDVLAACVDRAAGAARQARVALLAPPSPLVPAAWARAMRDGWELAPLDPRAPSAVLAKELATLRPDLLVVTAGAIAETVPSLQAGRPAPLAFADGWGLPAPAPEGVPEHLLRPASRAPASVERRAADAAAGAPARPDPGSGGASGGEGVRPLQAAQPVEEAQKVEAALLVSTSGTTGEPRRVRVTQSMLAAHAPAAAQRLGQGPSSVVVACMPMHRIGGLALADRAMRTASHVRFTPWDVARVAEALQDATHVSLVPAQLAALRQHMRRPPNALRCALVGGDLLPPQMAAEALEDGWPVHATYGCTEASSQVATATPEELREAPGTVGRPLACTHVAVATSSDAEGGAGELVLSGPAVAGGRHRTGDVGRFEGGLLFVAGRLGDRITTGGEKVWPAAVEEVLRAHPAVQDACVVGLQDAVYGSRVAAAVVLHAPVSWEELSGWCRQRLPRAAVPRAWRQVAALPRTEAGKLRRAAVRAGWQQTA